MKLMCFALLFCFLSTFKNYSQSKVKILNNPFLVNLNVPVDYAKVTAKDLEVYANTTLVEVTAMITAIKKQKATTFLNVFVCVNTRSPILISLIFLYPISVNTNVFLVKQGKL